MRWGVKNSKQNTSNSQKQGNGTFTGNSKANISNFARPKADRAARIASSVTKSASEKTHRGRNAIKTGLAVYGGIKLSTVLLGAGASTLLTGKSKWNWL
jgi:hypothetical protein